MRRYSLILLMSCMFGPSVAFAPAVRLHSLRNQKIAIHQTPTTHQDVVVAVAGQNATTSNTAECDWVSAAFNCEQSPRTEAVVGPGRVLIYDTSLRGMFTTKKKEKGNGLGFIHSHSIAGIQHAVIHLLTYSYCILFFHTRRNTRRVRVCLCRRQDENLQALGCV